MSSKAQTYAVQVKVFGENARYLCTLHGVRARALVSAGTAKSLSGKRSICRAIQLIPPPTNDLHEKSNSGRHSLKFTHRDPVQHNPFLIGLKRFDEETGLYVRWRG